MWPRGSIEMMTSSGTKNRTLGDTLANRSRGTIIQFDRNVLSSVRKVDEPGKCSTRDASGSGVRVFDEKLCQMLSSSSSRMLRAPELAATRRSFGNLMRVVSVLWRGWKPD